MIPQARIVEEAPSVHHGSRWALRCACGVTRGVGPDLASVRADLLARHRLASPRCPHLALIERATT